MSVASKNLFALLGNDEEEPPSGPVKTVDKTTMRTTKRGVEPEAPTKPTNASAARRGPSGNEGALRDRNAGSRANQSRGTDDAQAARGGGRGGRGARDRGGPGSGRPRNRDDRHSKSQPSGGTEKQAALAWGANEGDAEAKDEQAGEEIAQKEFKEAAVEDAEGPETPAEPETKTVSYTDYLAQQLEKKAALADALEIRKANEGSKTDKKWANAKALDKEEAEDFITPSGGKAKRERERKAKNVLDIDQAWVESNPPPTTGAPRGGRGGARGDGGRGRGDGAPRGDGARGDGARGGNRGRGEGRGRGGARGSDFPRGGARGGRDSAGFNANDQSAFPSLGA
ncbi:plasminogen activator inhibitor 1 RNA-binding protein [Microdochium nivale]|nr:plasminogen activator inhibitor 1 RNA-binding protein [Microdochium nivale]